MIEEKIQTSSPVPMNGTMADKEERDDNLQRYELIYLISNKFAENELEPITSSVLKLIKDGNGIIITEENWGKKRQLLFRYDCLGSHF